ncbi:hypothetical protein BFP70_11535 [Thioclava sp. SK-1]|uniref:hypothetical protein n=1 Tax=Thioclava sp. SK-1 TaxID=1889770 RepID=UPI0008252FD0|nr:hypothetical protein [Thioclava sp. SK-1]OCX64640.1 hypothetical protein BFP70_11535 [Thioclava sp. SK-1]
MHAIAITAAQSERYEQPAHRPVVLRAEQRALLDEIRAAALRVRSTRYIDAFRACAMLSLNRDRSVTTMADGLARVLAQALAAPAVLYRPGSPDVSFDEAWLVRLAYCLHDDDLGSAEFLLRSRVTRHHWRNIAFLLNGIARLSSLQDQRN